MSLFNDNGSFAENPGGTGSSQTGGQSGKDNGNNDNLYSNPTKTKTATPAVQTPASTLDIAKGALTGATLGSALGAPGMVGGAVLGGLYQSGYSPSDFLQGVTSGTTVGTPSIQAANEANQNENAGGDRSVVPGVGSYAYTIPDNTSYAPINNGSQNTGVTTLPGQGQSSTGGTAYGGSPPLPTDIYGLASGFVGQNNPMMRSARTTGLQQANSRGLLNSSMGIQAAQKSAIDAALPAAAQMSQQNSATNLQRENIAAYDREKAASLAAAYEQTYSSLFNSIMSNPDIPAAARESYLAQIGAQRDSNLGLLEQFYGIQLQWNPA